MSKQSLFTIGDLVKPKPEWINDPNEIPSGRVKSIAACGAVYVEGERRAFAPYVFEKDEHTPHEGKK